MVIAIGYVCAHCKTALSLLIDTVQVGHAVADVISGSSIVVPKISIITIYYYD